MDSLHDTRDIDSTPTFSGLFRASPRPVSRINSEQRIQLLEDKTAYLEKIIG
jgi:hypothetical protein